MLRFVFLLLLTAAMPVFGQQPTVQPVNRPVLRALPLGGDDVLVSRQVPGAAAPGPSARGRPVKSSRRQPVR